VEDGEEDTTQFISVSTASTWEIIEFQENNRAGETAHSGSHGVPLTGWLSVADSLLSLKRTELSLK
jgi:hypothetical protein